MIFDCICDDIPLQMKVLNMVIPNLMHFCSLISNWSAATHINPYVIAKCDIINGINLFPTVCMIYCCNFLCYPFISGFLLFAILSKVFWSAF